MQLLSSGVRVTAALNDVRRPPRHACSEFRPLTARPIRVTRRGGGQARGPQRCASRVHCY